MIEPHGGKLVDREVDRRPDDVSLSDTIEVTKNQYQDLINIASGRYSPLRGFMGRNDFLKVVRDMTLEDGTPWPLPIVLDVDAETASTLSPGERIGLEYPVGTLVGTIDIDEVYKSNTEETVHRIYGTDDPSHPGVGQYAERGAFFLGGSVSVFQEHRYNEFDLLPAESRVLFQDREWNSVVGFQTRNAPHRSHEYLQKTSLEQVDGLLVQPKLGAKKAGDYRDDVIIDAYRTLLSEYYPRDRTALSVFPSKMRYAGPREAVFDAIVRKNQGCTHFVVGRDHAGVGDYYDSFDSQHIFQRVADLGIEPMFYDYAFYCETCDGMVSEHVCPHDGDVRITPSGSQLRAMIRDGDTPSKRLMRPEVVDTIMNHDDVFVTEAEATAR